MEWGPAAGARVSAADRRTRTSDSGTDVCITVVAAVRQQ